MGKIKCENPVCGTSFFFNEKKNPNATKVRCPKCKNIQLLPTETIKEEMEEVDDWLRREPKASPSSPIVQNSFIETPATDENIKEEEDFFSPQKAKPAEEKVETIKRDERQVERLNDIGWLIVHDENTETATFNLRKGINRIGRKSNTTPYDVNIAINTRDQYMSREHCDIEVRTQGSSNKYIYVLTDRRSSNGTFVNAGRRLSRSEEVILRDGDTVQVGRTKLILKSPVTVNDSKSAEEWVRNIDYAPTIIQ